MSNSLESASIHSFAIAKGLRRGIMPSLMDSKMSLFALACFFLNVELVAPAVGSSKSLVTIDYRLLLMPTLDCRLSLMQQHMLEALSPVCVTLVVVTVPEIEIWLMIVVMMVMAMLEPLMMVL